MTLRKILIFLAFLVVAVYFNSLSNDFLSDDIAEIKENPQIGQFYYFQDYFHLNLKIPINAVIYHIFGLNPTFFRLPNIFFHLGSVLLIYRLIGFFFAAPIPLFTAGIFAVHPILTEAVTWISGGPYSGSAFFILLSFVAYLIWGKTPQKKFYLASLASFILALGFSEKAIWFPAILILYEFCFVNLKKNWQKLLPFITLGGLWLYYLLGLVEKRITSLETTSFQSSGLDNPLIKIPIAIISYLELIFWPKNLTLYHSELAFSQIKYLATAGVFGLFLMILFYSYQKSRRLFFWLAFFLIALSPTLTPLKIAWVVAERYVYLGALGIFVVVAAAIQKIAEVGKNPKIAYALFGIVLVILSTRTIIRNHDWQNQDNLWLATAKTSPSSPQNHNNLGDLYGRQGNLEKAAEEFKIAIKLKPNYGDAYHNLANIYHQMGQDDLAAENYLKAISFNPNLWQSHQNLAALYFNRGEFKLSLQELQQAANINPENANLHANLGIVFLKLNEKAKAKEAFLRALQFDPQNQKLRAILTEL